MSKDDVDKTDLFRSRDSSVTASMKENKKETYINTPDSASNSRAAGEDGNLEQEILLDLCSTFSDSKMDTLIDAEDDRVTSPRLWKSSEESSEDSTVDPLFFYSSQCNETSGEAEPIYVPSQQSMQPHGTGSERSLERVSFVDMKPLYGHLEHSTSATSATTATTQSTTDSSVHFRDYQCEQWAEHFEELRAFSVRNGHCHVSHRDQEHGALARWSKRQRYQYKLMRDGKLSTMTPARVEALNSLGFAWNSHEATWDERFEELRQFRSLHGHCNIPSCYDPNQKLATWAKCQRRQYKLLAQGRKSNMTLERVARLEELGFVWEMRPQRFLTDNDPLVHALACRISSEK